MNWMAGLSTGNDLPDGRTSVGLFFEYGSGDYDTYNSFASADPVHADGNTDYIGGGILGRVDFSRTEAGYFYTEASARLGKVEIDYHSGDLRDFLGRNASWNTDSLYYGAHIGAGYVFDLNGMAWLDLSAKYLWTHQEGDDVQLSTGDPVNFSDVDSQRLRAGARLSWHVTEYANPYVGAFWEHEFDGDASASSHGYAFDTPSLKGDTGIGELGLKIEPEPGDGMFSLDVGIQGYTGQREGITGMVQIKYEF